LRRQAKNDRVILLGFAISLAHAPVVQWIGRLLAEELM
jgi:hypothetical protein